MKILLCHTYYTQRGGEDRSFEEERDLLRAGGHDVFEYVRRNEEMHALGAARALAVTLWNRQAAEAVGDLIRRARPDVLHATNTFPLISPAVCRVAHRAGVAVVQALRNYRLLCANASLLRDGAPCDACVGRLVPWRAVAYRCRNESLGQSAGVAAMQVVHRALGTWRRVDAFFTLTRFAREKFVAAGLPADRLHVKYNSVSPDPGVGAGDGGYVAFAARLAPEKGVATVLEAWRKDSSLPCLKIAGDGPLAADVAAAAAQDSRIEWLGHRTESEVHRVFGAATAVLMPSIWYETFGRTIAEAFAGGAPVIASRLGAMAELVDEGRTGWLFPPGDSAALAARVAAATRLSADARRQMRAAARAEYERKFTPQHNYSRLLEIYELALAASRERVMRRIVGASDRRRPAVLVPSAASSTAGDARLSPAKT